jgi:hypothetical protein
VPVTPPKLDLSQVGLLTEIIVRGGDLRDTRNSQRQILQANYRQVGQEYTIHGLSVFVSSDPVHPQTYQMLASRNRVFNKRLSISVIGAIKSALAQAGFGMILYVTPYPDLPDHHDLVVYRIDPTGNALSADLDELEDGAADAIIAAIIQVEDNPTPARRP